MGDFYHICSCTTQTNLIVTLLTYRFNEQQLQDSITRMLQSNPEQFKKIDTKSNNTMLAVNPLYQNNNFESTNDVDTEYNTMNSQLNETDTKMLDNESVFNNKCVDDEVI